MADEYVCDICGKKFRNERGLLVHKTKVHLSERKYECPYCGKKFLTPQELAFHTKATHFEEEVKKAVQEALGGTLGQEKKNVENRDRNTTNNKTTNDKEEVAMAEINEAYLDKLLNMQRQTFEKEIEVFKERLQRVQDSISRQVEKEVEQTVSQRVKEISDGISKQIEELRNAVNALSSSLSEGTNGQKQLAGKLKEISQKVSSLEEVATKKPNEIKEVVEKVSSFEQKLQNVPTKDEIKSLIDECILDPNSKACARITELVSSTATPKEKGIHIEHSTWDEVFQCPECMEEFSSIVSKHPEFLSRALSKLGEKDKDTLAGIISSFVPKEEKKNSFF